MVRLLYVLFYVFGIEPNVFKLALAIKGSLIGKMLIAWFVALTARNYRARFYFWTKFYNRNKTVPDVAISFFCIWSRSSPVSGQ